MDRYRYGECGESHKEMMYLYPSRKVSAGKSIEQSGSVGGRGLRVGKHPLPIRNSHWHLLALAYRRCDLWGDHFVVVILPMFIVLFF